MYVGPCQYDKSRAVVSQTSISEGDVGNIPARASRACPRRIFTPSIQRDVTPSMQKQQNIEKNNLTLYTKKSDKRSMNQVFHKGMDETYAVLFESVCRTNPFAVGRTKATRASCVPRADGGKTCAEHPNVQTTVSGKHRHDTGNCSVKGYFGGWLQ